MNNVDWLGGGLRAFFLQIVYFSGACLAYIGLHSFTFCKFAYCILHTCIRSFLLLFMGLASSGFFDLLGA